MTSKPISNDTADTAAKLAEEHGAVTLATALLARLQAEGRAELAAAVSAALHADGAFIDVTPPNPHRGGP